MPKTEEKTDTAGPVIPAAESQQSVSRTARRLMDVKLQVRVRFGRATLPLKEILQLTSGSLVELDEQPDDASAELARKAVRRKGVEPDPALVLHEDPERMPLFESEDIERT